MRITIAPPHSFVQFHLRQVKCKVQFVHLLVTPSFSSPMSSSNALAALREASSRILNAPDALTLSADEITATGQENEQGAGTTLGKRTRGDLSDGEDDGSVDIEASNSPPLNLTGLVATQPGATGDAASPFGSPVRIRINANQVELARHIARAKGFDDANTRRMEEFSEVSPRSLS